MDERPEQVSEAQAQARRMAERVALHMALEGQALEPDVIEALVAETTARILAQHPGGG